MGVNAPTRGSVRAGYFFAGTMMLLIGVVQFVAGLAAIINDQFFVLGAHYAYSVDVTAWGWIHLILGIVVALAGWSLFTAQTWARIAGIVLASLSAIANFFFIPYYPFWAIVIIALDVFVIWSLTKHVDEWREGA